MAETGPILQRIKEATGERALLSLAYECQGSVRVGLMQPGDYADCMIALAEKLGFGITDEALAEAAAKFLD